MRTRYPLQAAAKNRDAETVKRLLSEGIEIDTRNEDGETALLVAAWNGSTGVIELLLQEGADINASDDYGWTALINAAAQNHAEVVSLLLDQGADTRMRNEKGHTALLEAYWRRHSQVIALLRTRQASIDLDEAAALGDLKAFLALLAADRETKGPEALVMAIYYHHTEWVPQLLEQGIYVNAITESGWTAFMAAAFRGDVALAQLLLNKGANPGSRNRHGETALDIAVQAGHPGMVDYLKHNLPSE